MQVQINANYSFLMNNAKLTYLYFLSFVVCLLSSCTSDTPDVDPGKGAEMYFDVSDQTRAAVTTSIDEFVVYGDIKSPTNETSNSVVMFNKTKVEYKNGSWSYDDTQYWIPNYEHSFVAIHPGVIFENGNAPKYLNSELSFEYSIPAAGGILSSTSDVADILVATHRRLYKKVGSVSDLENKVTLKFGHVMSLINIAPALNDNGMSRDGYIQFHKLELSGVKSKAQFNIAPAQRQSNSQTDDMTIDVNGQEEGNLTIVLKTPVKVGNDTKNVRLFADNDAIIMLPQAFAADSESVITLYYTTNDDTSMNEVSLPLKNLKWESGKSYMYKFTLERSGLVIDSCEINPWNVVKGEDITVD